MRVELSDVSVKFGAIAALRDVSVELPSGARAAVIGPNGAGKSTLMRVIMGMIACRGEVRLDGRSPFLHRAELAHRLAYVPQVAPRLGATVGELVRAVAQLRDLPVARCEDKAHALDLDLAAVRRQPMRDLSGGMRQKLLLALALATDASLLILDEPTASLDVQSRRRFFELVAELPHQPSILLCSHRLEEIRHLVDRVWVLEDGALTYQGDARDYLRQTAEGVLEVSVGSARAERWLDDHGFRRASAGWWTCAVRNGNRIQLVEQTVSALGEDLSDLVVRDVERLTGTTRSDTNPSDNEPAKVPGKTENR